jgi:hypothetical protein
MKGFEYVIIALIVTAVAYRAIQWWVALTKWYAARRSRRKAQ